MKALFLTIALSLFSILHADDLTFSEFKPLEGTYYVKAIAVDKEFPEEEMPKDMSPLTITYLNNGKMEAKFTMMKDDKCEEINMMLGKTYEPRRITMNRYLSYTCTTVKTSEEKHWILFCQREFQGKQIRMAKLLGPNTDENPKVLQDFYRFIHRERFDERRIITPKQSDFYSIFQKNLAAAQFGLKCHLVQFKYKKVN
ncbi:late lactation protein-like [Dromiciops gliroides]|uniref:late lactation protein-like n=1 Tax=Dromiciops gliroides TaxID=33562 RepID=UPI001CC63F98|nr:late lactation protein-like [Dromiciops gliroides]